VDEIRLFLLGSPHVERGDHFVEMDTRKALALFAYLVIAGSEQQRETLVALLYPEADPESARAAFRRTLSTLNSALGAGILSIRRDAVGVSASAPLWVDVACFQSRIKEMNNLAGLGEAVQLYRGDFMAGFSLRDSPPFDDWQYHQAESLRRLFDNALDRLASGLARQGKLDEAIEAAEKRTRLDPLLEEAQRQLIELYARSGQRGAALHQYRECVRILDQELGVAPLAETTGLYQDILKGKYDSKHAPVRLANAPSQKIITTASQSIPPLVGREEEMSGLLPVLSQNQSGVHFIAIVGEPGVGKTRLAEEFLSSARLQGRIVAQARCYQGQLELAYTPFLEAVQTLLDNDSLTKSLSDLPPEVLIEASRLFPKLRKDRALSPAPEGPGTQARFFESLRLVVNQLLGGQPPGIIFLDDLHWADSGTVELISFLARRGKPDGYIILTVWRDEYGPVIDRLNLLLAELQRTNTSRLVPVKRMSQGSIETLARSIYPDLSPELSQRLFQESEGLPFIALEYLHAGGVTHPEWKIPGGVRALLHQRLSQPGETARQLLSSAAVIGRSFDFQTLHSISGRSDWEMVNGIEELLRLGLVREDPPNGYDFSHEKLRALVYEETSLARRRLLHQRAADLLVASGSGGKDSGSWAGMAASHFMQAGQPQRAADYFRQAGDHARQLHSNQQALTAYQSALAAGYPDPASLHEACGDLLTLSGEYGAAVASYQTAAALCEPGCLSNLMHKMGEVFQRRGDWDAAESHYQMALEVSGDSAESSWKSHLFADWSLTAYRANQTRKAQDLAEKALSAAETSQEAAALAQSLNMLGILARGRGDLDMASNYFERSLYSVQDTDHLSLRCAALHNLARLEQERDHLAEAVKLALEALEYCTLLGDLHHRAALLNTLADLHHMLGRESESMSFLKQAVALFAEIGEDAGENQPEIWKLTEW
jgi:DNA-binding SARP family transcriptional activator